MGLTFHDEAIGRNLPGYRDKCIPQMLGGDYHGDVRHVCQRSNASLKRGMSCLIMLQVVSLSR